MPHSFKKLDAYKGTTPPTDVKSCFTGPLKAWGLVQDWRGRVVSRFAIDLVGTWKGDEGTLEEDYTYDDGTQKHRVWHIKKITDDTYEAEAPELVGKGRGKSEGMAINWNYVMDVPVGDKTYRLSFDDWLWQIEEGVYINRSYLKKFGITVAELTIFMQKT